MVFLERVYFRSFCLFEPLQTYLKIWNMGVQELFTELKNIHRRPSNDATNMAPFRVFLAIYRGKWPKNGLKINWYPKILSTGRSQNPHFCFGVRFYGTLRTDEAGF